MLLIAIPLVWIYSCHEVRCAIDLRAGTLLRPDVFKLKTVGKTQMTINDFFLVHVPAQQYRWWEQKLVKESLSNQWSIASVLYGLVGCCAFYWLMLLSPKQKLSGADAPSWLQIAARFLLAGLAGFIVYKLLIWIGALTDLVEPTPTNDLAHVQRTLQKNNAAIAQFIVLSLIAGIFCTAVYEFLERWFPSLLSKTFGSDQKEATSDENP